MAQSIRIENVTALTPGGILEGAVILVENGRFKYVGAASGAPELKADRTLDATGRVAMPTFVNTHTHASMSYFRGFAADLPLRAWLESIWPIEDRLDDEAVHWGTMIAVAEMLQSGTGAFCDMYMRQNVTAKVVLDSGIRAVLSEGMTGYGDTAAKLANTRALFKDFNGEEERVRVYVAPHAEYTCDTEFMDACVELAAELGTHIHTHISETDAEVNDCYDRRGISPVKFMKERGVLKEGTVAAHCVSLSDEDIAILAESGIYIAHNPGSNLKLGSGIAPVPKLIAAGAHIALGTDSVGSNNNLDMWEEMTLAALIHKGVNRDPLLISAAEAFVLSNREGAKALGFADTGCLETGQKADMVLVDVTGVAYTPDTDMLQHIVHSGKSSDIVLTMVDGRVLYENGVFTTIDIEKAKYEFARKKRELFAG